MAWRTSFILGPTSASAMLIGTPWLWNRSDWRAMTSGKRVRAVPRGWWPTIAEIVSPFSLSLSARRTSAGPMSMPHIMRTASMSSSGRYDSLVSA